MSKEIRKTYKYRIYPGSGQETKLLKQFDLCRNVYNSVLHARRSAWDERGESMTCFDTIGLLPAMKEEHPELSAVHSQVLQNVCRRVDSAFQAFFRRVKAKKEGKFDGKPGYPRFKGEGRYNSLTYPQAGFKLNDDCTRLQLSKVGAVKIKFHRGLKGKVKTLCITRSATGKWYACFSVEQAVEEKPSTGKVTGIDVGLESFLTFSDGRKIDNPRFLKSESENLAKEQRRLSRLEKYSKAYDKQKERIERIHERITNKRQDFAHKTSRKIVDSFQLVAFEKLDISGMMNGNWRSMNRSIGDVAWSKFLSLLASKAAEAGRKAIGIDPAGTSQTCSGCGEIVRKSLSERTHQCPSCGLCLDRDHNAARNILALGLQSLG